MIKGWKKYVVVLFITSGIFACSWYISTLVNAHKIAEIQDLHDKVSTDILASETQFGEDSEMISCDSISNTSGLSKEIGSLADRISFAEQNVAVGEELAALKKQYTILLVKDFLLTKRIAERCKLDLATILYFYSDKESCADCAKQGYVLDAIREEYDQVRVYAFDYRLDLSTVKVLLKLYDIDGALPAIVVDGKTYRGFQSLAEVRQMLPEGIREI